MEEVSSLLYVNQYVREKAFDVLLLDCAPTGESLRFVSIPTTLEWYMSKLFKVERRLGRHGAPDGRHRGGSTRFQRMTTSRILNRCTRKLSGIDQLMADPKITTVRLVTNPEKVVAEGNPTSLHLLLPLGVNH